MGEPTSSQDEKSRAESVWLRRCSRTLLVSGFVCTACVVLLTATLYLFLVRHGAASFEQESSFILRGTPGLGGVPTPGLLTLVGAALLVTFIGVVIGSTFGLAGAVFISEYSADGFRETMKVVVELLAAIPPIVWGILGVVAFGQPLLQGVGGTIWVDLLRVGAVVGLMSAPLVCSIAEDAIRAVPDAYRVAAEALGATKLEVVERVLLPAARSGIVAALSLGIGRSVSQTVALLSLVQFPFFVRSTGKTPIPTSPLFSIVLVLLSLAILTNLAIFLLTQHRRRVLRQGSM